MKKDKVLKTYCCECGKVLGQGIPKGDDKQGYGKQDKRRFHATCWNKAKKAKSDHYSYRYNDKDKNYYDMKQHYNFVNKAYKKTPTCDITRELEYKKHNDAINWARKKQEEFDKKYGFVF